MHIFQDIPHDNFESAQQLDFFNLILLLANVISKKYFNAQAQLKKQTFEAA